MADYTYTGVSIYINNVDENKYNIAKMLYILEQYIGPLNPDYILPNIPQPEEVFDDIYDYYEMDWNITYEINEGQYRGFFYTKDEQLPGGVPKGKRAFHTDIHDNQLYMFIPITSKRLNNVLLKPVMATIIDHVEDSIEQISYITAKEYENYNDKKPIVLIRNGKSVI